MKQHTPLNNVMHPLCYSSTLVKHHSHHDAHRIGNTGTENYINVKLQEKQKTSVFTK